MFHVACACVHETSSKALNASIVIADHSPLIFHRIRCLAGVTLQQYLVCAFLTVGSPSNFLSPLTHVVQNSWLETPLDDSKLFKKAASGKSTPPFSSPTLTEAVSAFITNLDHTTPSVAHRRKPVSVLCRWTIHHQDTAVQRGQDSHPHAACLLSGARLGRLSCRVPRDIPHFCTARVPNARTCVCSASSRQSAINAVPFVRILRHRR
jgi:hypothetical protein